MANNPFVYAESVSYTKKNLMRGTANDELAEVRPALHALECGACVGEVEHAIDDGLDPLLRRPFSVFEILRDADGRELMTNADPAFWTGHAPILFPVIGMTYEKAIRLGGTSYPMAKHGFARHSLFDTVAQSDASVTFALTDSAETRAAYPFAFRLEITFTLQDATLHIEARIQNPAAEPMPATPICKKLRR